MNLQHRVGHCGEHMLSFQDEDVPHPQCQGEWSLGERAGSKQGHSGEGVQGLAREGWSQAVPCSTTGTYPTAGGTMSTAHLPAH